MGTKIGGFFFLAFVAVFPGAARAGSPSAFQPTPTRYEMLLLPQDVERVSKFDDVKLMPKDPMAGASGVLNFALPRGQLILMLDGEDIDPAEFAKLKKTPQFKAMFALHLPELGDDAYAGPNHMGNLYVLSFQKGNHWVTLTAGFSRRTGKPFLDMAQLRELAEVVLDRL